MGLACGLCYKVSLRFPFRMPASDQLEGQANESSMQAAAAQVTLNVLRKCPHSTLAMTKQLSGTVLVDISNLMLLSESCLHHLAGSQGTQLAAVFLHMHKDMDVYVFATTACTPC